MPYRLVAERLLAEWRAAERRLASVGPDAHAAEGVRREIARIRDEYQRAIENARREHLPAPPPAPWSERD